MAVSARYTLEVGVLGVGIATCLIQPGEASWLILFRERPAPACIARAIEERGARTGRSNFADASIGRRRFAGNESNWMRSAAFSFATRASSLPRLSTGFHR